MKKAVAIRFVIGALLIAGLLIGYQMFQKFAQDPDLGTFESVNYIVALQTDGRSTHAVMFDNNGKEILPPKPNKERWDDREITWSPDGQRVFLSSTRETDSYVIYRWNPAKNKVERRSLSNRSQSGPWFGSSDTATRASGLIQSGGLILDLAFAEGKTTQVLPPPVDPTQGEEEGRRSSIETLYGRFGDSFVTARYIGNKNTLIGIMRNDTGQTAVLHVFGTDANGNPNMPHEIFRGHKVDVESAPGGQFVLLVRNMEWPDPTQVPEEFIKDGKVTRPFESALFIGRVHENGQPEVQPILAMPPGMMEGPGDFSISPDGSKIAVVIGHIDDHLGFTPLGLIVMPLAAGGGQQAVRLMQGEISDVSWNGDGSRLAYLKREGGKADIYTLSADGSDERKVTTTGNMLSPQYSPQVKTN